MKIKNVNIEIPKMDYQIINLSLKQEGEAVELLETDLMFFTVKKKEYDDKFLFQKSIGNGIAFNEETSKYEIVITSEDTKNMEMNKEYGYDITIYYDGNKPKQKVVGSFVLSKKFTTNEVM